MKKLEDESGPLTMDLMDVPRYILELRDEIKSLRAEVEAWEYGKPKCTKCYDCGYIPDEDSGYANQCDCGAHELL